MIKENKEGHVKTPCWSKNEHKAFGNAESMDPVLCFIEFVRKNASGSFLDQHIVFTYPPLFSLIIPYNTCHVVEDKQAFKNFNNSGAPKGGLKNVAFCPKVGLIFIKLTKTENVIKKLSLIHI